MTISKALYIPKKEIQKYNALMQAETVDYTENDIPRYSSIKTWTVNLGLGYEVDIKICSADDDIPLWCEGVLFLNGWERYCTEVRDQLDGEYYFEDGENNYTITVKAEENLLKENKNMKEVLCIRNFVEDDTEYWSKDCYYEFIGMDNKDYLIRTNYNAEGRVYAEDFNEYFKLV